LGDDNPPNQIVVNRGFRPKGRDRPGKGGALRTPEKKKRGLGRSWEQETADVDRGSEGTSEGLRELVFGNSTVPEQAQETNRAKGYQGVKGETFEAGTAAHVGGVI